MYWLGLLGLLSVPVLVGIYFFRIKFPEKIVSSTFLWDFPETRLSRGLKRNRFMSERSFWLELLALLLVVLLLLKMDTIFPTKDQHALYVLDNSFAMQAMVGDTPIYKKIIEEIEAEIRHTPKKITIIIASEAPLILAGSVEESLSYLRDWQPSAVAFDWFMTKELIREVSSAKTQIFVYSDRRIPFDEFERSVHIRTKGLSQGNAYLLTVFRDKKVEGDVLGVYAGYAGNTPAVLNCNVTIGEDKQNLVLKKMSDDLLFGELRLKDPQATVKVQLEDDALLFDNHFYLLPEKKKIWKLELAIKDEALKTNMLKVLRVFKEIQLVASDGDCVVSDQGVLKEGVPHILLGLGQVADGQSSTDFMGQYISESGHSLLKDLDLSDFIAQGVLKSDERIYPLVHKNGYILFGKLQNQKSEVYVWNIDFKKTDVFSRYMWPLFWENALVHFSKQLEGLESTNLQTGDENVYRSMEPLVLQLQDPDGVVTELRGLAKQDIHLPVAKKPGVYKLMTAEKELATYQCNLVDQHSSYLLGSTEETLVAGKKSLDDGYLRALHDSNSLFILAVVLLLLFVYLLNVYLEFRQEGVKHGV